MRGGREWEIVPPFSVGRCGLLCNLNTSIFPISGANFVSPLLKFLDPPFCDACRESSKVINTAL